MLRRLETLTPGSLVGGRYKVAGLLGVGGFSAVYHVHDRLRGVDCALKMLHVPPQLDRGVLRRFEREARIQRQIDNPRICRLLDFEELEGTALLALELVHGWT